MREWRIPHKWMCHLIQCYYSKWWKVILTSFDGNISEGKLTSTVFRRECTEENAAFFFFLWWCKATFGTWREGRNMHVSCTWSWLPHSIPLVVVKSSRFSLLCQIILLLTGNFMHNYLVYRLRKRLTFLLKNSTYALWLLFSH